MSFHPLFFYCCHPMLLCRWYVSREKCPKWSLRKQVNGGGVGLCVYLCVSVISEMKIGVETSLRVLIVLSHWISLCPLLTANKGPSSGHRSWSALIWSPAPQCMVWDSAASVSPDSLLECRISGAIWYLLNQNLHLFRSPGCSYPQ